MNILEKLTHIELFSGLGSASIALREAKIPHTTIARSEICKHAEALRSELVDDGSYNFGDITDYTNWNADSRLTDADIVSGGFPCQDFSGMGTMKGWSSPRTIVVTSAVRDFVLHHKPKIIVLENVTAVFNKTHGEGTRAWLDSFQGYNWNYVVDNPHDRGHIQSRSRVWITLSRSDAPQMDIDLSKFSKIKSQQWKDIADKRVLKSDLKGEYFVVNDVARISSKPSNKHWRLIPTSTKIQCMTRKAILSRCNRFSWVDDNGTFRSISTRESLKAFAHPKTPLGLTTKNNLSRSSCSKVIGNSWHIDAAINVFSQLPIEELKEFKFVAFAMQFIRVDKVLALANRRTAKNIRALYTIDQLMTSKRSNNRRQLFATSSYKFDKKDGKKITTKGVYLAPADDASDPKNGIIINNCPMAGECAEGTNCLTGSGTMPFHADTREAKTLFFYAYPMEFCIQYIREIYEHARLAVNRGDELQARGNGTSDIQWELYLKMNMLVDFIEGFIGFYDYTKLGASRLSRIEKESYHLTFSVSEHKDTISNALAYLQAGYSVSIVVVPSEHEAILAWGHPRVIDGELNDHRPQDPKGAVVLLPARGTLRSQIGKTKFVKSSAWVASFLAIVDTSCEA